MILNIKENNLPPKHTKKYAVYLIIACALKKSQITSDGSYTLIHGCKLRKYFSHRKITFSANNFRLFIKWYVMT